MNTGFADTETTGLIKSISMPLTKQPHVYEYYQCSVDEFGNDISEFHQWIKPGISIPKESTKVTGIKDEDIKHYHGFDVYAQNIKNAIESLDELWFHNASYDVAVINYEMQRCGLSIIWPNVRCSVEETEHLKGHRLKLTDLHIHLFGTIFESAHSAINDVQALKRCVLKLKELGEV